MKQPEDTRDLLRMLWDDNAPASLCHLAAYCYTHGHGVEYALSRCGDDEADWLRSHGYLPTEEPAREPRPGDVWLGIDGIVRFLISKMDETWFYLYVKTPSEIHPQQLYGIGELDSEHLCTYFLHTYVGHINDFRAVLLAAARGE